MSRGWLPFGAGVGCMDGRLDPRPVRTKMRPSAHRRGTTYGTAVGAQRNFVGVVRGPRLGHPSDAHETATATAPGTRYRGNSA